MTGVLKFIIALALVVGLGVAALHIDVVTGSAGSAERKLERDARAALGIRAAEWASVRMDGQKAIVAGEAPSPESRDALIERISAAEWNGGLVVGGVTAVDATGLTVAPEIPLASPFVFIVEVEGDVVMFAGNVPDQPSRDRLFQLAGDLYPEAEISGSLDIARGTPIGAADWSQSAAEALHALSFLRHGALHAEDTTFTITGEAENETRAGVAQTLIDSLPLGLVGKAEIVIRPPPETIEDIISQSLQEDEESQIAEVATPDCRAELATLIAGRKIGFTSARADIDNASRDHLRRVAEQLNRCADTRLHITGHTDSSGNAGRNRQLSGYRADAVRAFLISVGAPADRLSVSGAGSSEPVASNRTPAGREQNRRIEIEIVTAE